MGKTKVLFEQLQYEDMLGEEHRAYIYWIEQEQYERYPKRKIDNIDELYDYD